MLILQFYFFEKILLFKSKLILCKRIRFQFDYNVKGPSNAIDFLA